MPKTHLVSPGDSLERGGCRNGSAVREIGEGPRVEGRRRLDVRSGLASSEGRRMAIGSSWS